MDETPHGIDAPRHPTALAITGKSATAKSAKQLVATLAAVMR